MEQQLRLKSGARQPTGDAAELEKRLTNGNPVETGTFIKPADPEAILQGIIWSEILGPPRCRSRRWR